METEELMYNAALSAEAKYLATFNATYGTNFDTLHDALNQFNTVSSQHDQQKLAYDKAKLTKKQAEDMLEKLGKSLDRVIVNHATNVIKQKFAQLQSTSSSQERAGYLDELNTISLLSELMAKYTRQQNKDDIYLELRAYAINQHSCDFSIGVNRYEMFENVEGYANGAYVRTNRVNLPLENKLHLDKFSLTKGKKINNLEQVSNAMLDDFYTILTNMKKEHTDKIEATAREMYGVGFTEDELYGMEVEYNFYTAAIDKDKYTQMLANILLYNKLKDSYPIFVTTENGQLQFKLCSEVISQFTSGFNTRTFTGLNNKTYHAAQYDTYTTEVGKQLNKKMIQSINSYQLWYGK